MKHWLWYNTNGAFLGSDVKFGGWEDDCNFSKPEGASDYIQSIINTRKSDGRFAGFYAYSCACLADKGLCNCPRDFMKYNALKDGKVQVKKDFAILLDGIIVENGSQVIKAAGSSIMLTLSSDLPDGTTIRLFTNPADTVAAYPESSAPLIFSDGKAGPLELAAPPRGFLSRLALHPDDYSLTYMQGFGIKGW